MSVRLLFDMNLSPDWIALLRAAGHDARHWSTVGNPRARDTELLAWARANGCAVLTHDLDSGTLLALTHADGPSVVQVRGPDVLPDAMGRHVLAALAQHGLALAAGALVVVDVITSRVRVLPF